MFIFSMRWIKPSTQKHRKNQVIIDVFFSLFFQYENKRLPFSAYCLENKKHKKTVGLLFDYLVCLYACVLNRQRQMVSLADRLYHNQTIEQPSA